MKLYKVSATLTAKGLEIAVDEWEAIDKKLTIMVSKTDKWGDLVRKTLRKENCLERIRDTRWINSNTRIGFEAWCYEKDIDEWKIACERSVIKTLRLYQSQLNDLAKHIQ